MSEPTIFDKDKLLYIPAILPSKDLYCKHKIGNKHSHFWHKDDSVWYYPNLLISTYHAMERGKDIDFREDMGIDKNVKVLGDSGGFQAVTIPDAYIKAEDVIKWQMRNCDAGLILDRPPYHFGGSAQFAGTPTAEFFNECLQITKDNAQIALDANHGPNKIRLYGVIQGETWSQINQWYNVMNEMQTEEKHFDAWALSPKPSNNPLKIAMFAIFIMEKKIKKPLHILQVSNRGGFLIAAYLRHLNKNLITVDSSSLSISGRYGLLVDPHNIASTFVIGDKKDKTNMKGWMCNCPVCKELKPDYSTWKEHYMPFLAIHNLHAYASFVQYADCIAQDYEYLYKIARTVSSNALRAISMIHYYKEFGFEKTAIKYNAVFGDVTVTQQKTIFDI